MPSPAVGLVSVAGGKYTFLSPALLELLARFLGQNVIGDGSVLWLGVKLEHCIYCMSVIVTGPRNTVVPR